MNKTLTTEQLNEPLVNYLRVHRRRIGLSQRELGQILGYRDETSVARHERFHSLPPLLIALSYEVVFQIPLSEIFPGLKQTVEPGVEERLTEFESRLQEQSSSSGFRAAAVARKLEWLSGRRSSGYQ